MILIIKRRAAGIEARQIKEKWFRPKTGGTILISLHSKEPFLQSLKYHKQHRNNK